MIQTQKQLCIRLNRENRLNRLNRLRSAENGLRSYREKMLTIGNALLVIRDESLYLDIGFKSFEAYLRLRARDDFGIDIKWAKKAIAYAHISGLLRKPTANTNRGCSPMIASKTRTTVDPKRAASEPVMIETSDQVETPPKKRKRKKVRRHKIEPLLIDANMIAALTSVSVRSLRRMIDAKEIPHRYAFAENFSGKGPLFSIGSIVIVRPFQPTRYYRVLDLRFDTP